MSWSVEVTGTREAARAEFSRKMDEVATAYAGKAEGDDVVAIKARGCSLIDDCDLTQDAYTSWNAVTVKASGSHSWTPQGIQSGQFQLSVTRTHLAI